MRTLGKFSSALAVLVALAPAALQSQGTEARPGQMTFLSAVGEHFNIAPREVAVLSRWKLSEGEIPVVLFLAERAGVSPDVVVVQRRRGQSWMEIAAAYSVHAGDFHVRIDGPAGTLGAASDRFSSRAASEWRNIPLTDEEVVGLVNVRFLSRFLGVPPTRVAQELGGAGGMVGVFQRLRGGGP